MVSPSRVRGETGLVPLVFEPHGEQGPALVGTYARDNEERHLHRVAVLAETKLAIGKHKLDEIAVEDLGPARVARPAGRDHVLGSTRSCNAAIVLSASKSFPRPGSFGEFAYAHFVFRPRGGVRAPKA